MIALSILVGLSLLLVSTDKEHIRCPKPRVEAAVGDNVTLECHLDPERDMTEKHFEWKLNGSMNVLVQRRGPSPDDQAEQFKHRVSHPSREKLSAGKLSVQISGVQPEDAGRYSCSVGKKEAKMSCSVELTINEPSSLRSPEDTGEGHQRPVDSTNVTTSEILGIACSIALAAIIGFAFLWWRWGDA